MCHKLSSVSPMITHSTELSEARIAVLIDLFVYLSLFLVYIITITNIYIHIKYTKPFYTELQETIAAKYMYIKSLSMYVT